ncbi:hypothetical protein EVAR_90352_1 [Eumeta japonica]|uniref:Uncharacterized protein n=1 Tax=Eumeta variegata TaxID=151549 RepID=A0A4C1YIT9_EUMVA|nr:hypothetical protein EVAR_90352_1 [Eumeta japonica]
MQRSYRLEIYSLSLPFWEIGRASISSHGNLNTLECIIYADGVHEGWHRSSGAECGGVRSGYSSTSGRADAAHSPCASRPPRARPAALPPRAPSRDRANTTYITTVV